MRVSGKANRLGTMILSSVATKKQYPGPPPLPPERAPSPGEPLVASNRNDQRGGAVQYLAAWDVMRGLVFGRCWKPKRGLLSFRRLVDQVMQQAPYCHADRVFWIVDNGSSHRGQSAILGLEAQYPNAIMVHTPVHASWLNQIEIYFSIIQRKV